MSNSMSNSVIINGVEYVPKCSVPAKRTGSKALVVADKGFIFAGHCEKSTMLGRAGVKILDAVIVRKWTSQATWAGVVNGPHEGVTLDKLGSDVFVANDDIKAVVDLADDWGE